MKGKKKSRKEGRDNTSVEKLRKGMQKGSKGTVTYINGGECAG